jgi:phytoene synthase
MVTSERPDIDLAIGYMPLGRDAARALFALDRQLAGIVARASEPLVGQMRLTWWREAIEALDRTPPPAEPILRALAEHVLPGGVHGAALAAITDGWEALLEQPLGDAAIARHGERGAVLFAALAQLSGADDACVPDAGRGWALADLARHLADGQTAQQTAALAGQHLARIRHHRWSRAGRALGALAVLARSDLDGAAPTRRMARMVRMRLTGS